MNFSDFNLHPNLMAGISLAGFEIPTPVQEEAIPPALEGRDIVGTAQTGTGKTAAFVLPILQKLGDAGKGPPRALVVTPTRELAQQIYEAIQTLGCKTNIKSVAIYGGVPSGPQIKALKSGVDILVACPGRLLDHVRQKNVSLNSIEILVLDEGDRMFDMGFLPDVTRILKLLPRKRQSMLFSATFPPAIERLASRTLVDPLRVLVGLIRPVHTVTHALYPVMRYSKSRLLLAMLAETDTPSVLIFTRTKDSARQLSQKIRDAGFKVTSLHSDRTQQQRQSALAGFKEGRYQIMVATDLAARGLDVENISHVINFDMPDSADAYIHRIGRTGRAEREGDAFTLVTTDDLPMIHQLEKIMGENIERKLLEEFDYSQPSSGSTSPKEAIAPEVRALLGGKGENRKKSRNLVRGRSRRFR